MILSLEEDEQEELQDVAQNVVTLDGEMMAVNGRVLAGHAPCAGGGLDTQGAYGKQDPDLASVCSCTCYGNKPKKDHSKHRWTQRRRRNRERGGESGESGGVGEIQSGPCRTRRQHGALRHNWVWRFIMGIFGFRNYQNSRSSDSNYFDEETQSISNIAKFSVKRSSL